MITFLDGFFFARSNRVSQSNGLLERSGDTAFRLERQQGVRSGNLILLCVERLVARVMHLSRTRGPHERHAGSHNCSVLGEVILSITEYKTFYTAHTSSRRVSWIGSLGETVHDGRFRFMLLTCAVTCSGSYTQLVIMLLFLLSYWRYKSKL